MAKADIGHRTTERMINDLDKRINSIYVQAEKEIQEKLESFDRKFASRVDVMQAKIASGEISAAQYQSWMEGQIFQQKQWQDKRTDIINVMRESNQTAADIVNKRSMDAFALNANYASYSLERDASIDFGFRTYDASTVSRLLERDRQLFPNLKVNKAKDYKWNNKKINNAILQGIIQGEGIDKISKRIAKGLATQNKNAMKTFARTAMTGAQNAGRLDSFKRAQNMGIELQKVWMATLDSHTRDSHADIDGEAVPVDATFSNGCVYPGDPGGPPAEVYNCRCTMVSEIKKYPSVYSRRDNETGEVVNKLGPDTVDNLNYRDWELTKSVMQRAKDADKRDNITQTLLQASALGGGTINYPAGSKMSLDYKYKGFDSMYRKLTVKSAKKGLTKAEYADRVTDALRFTNLSSPDTLTDDYFKMVGALESKGYKMVEVTNTFEKYASYRGINTTVQSPNGYQFELQFHTPQSLEIKDINHKLYEEERKLKAGDPRIEELIRIQNNNAKSIVSPFNVGAIKNIGD